MALMAIAVAYGAYTFFFASASRIGVADPKKSLEEINRFVTDIALGLKDDVSETHLYVLGRGVSTWSRDPFLETRAADKVDVLVKTRAEGKPPEETYRYTGYLQMGVRALAIINGLEYLLGDELQSGGRIVKEIDPLKVVIGPRDDNHNTILPLEETQ